MNNKTLKLMGSLFIVSLLSACQSNNTESVTPFNVNAPVNDNLRKTWSCKVQLEHDIHLSFAVNDFYGVLALPKNNPDSSTQRLRADFKLPHQVSDIISISFTEPNQNPLRLMKGYTPKRVCGDYFIRNPDIGSDTLTLFSDLPANITSGKRQWKIMYINHEGIIVSTEKVLLVVGGASSGESLIHHQK